MREKIRMQSSESSFSYTTTKNKKKSPDKLKLKRFDPKLRKHVLFEEGKIKG